MKNNFKLYFFAWAIIAISQNIIPSSGITLEKDGGYNLVVAIQNGEPKDNAQTIIDNIKSVVGTLSNKMWLATRERFHIASLEIIIPKDWGIVTSGDAIYSYKTSDIRINSKAQGPYVENLNLCGQPGDYIELPKNFFNNANSGDWGENWKVLLVEWARYRWGAYEEHGLPGDKKFPYFTKDPAATGNDPKWLLNGCTNAPNNKLDGVYRKLDGTACDATSNTELDPACRFFPNKDGNTEVTSSLMHLHFMESVFTFCDKDTHQKHVPTKQNLYCDNKSVMETIESSPDYKAVTEPRAYVPILRTKVSTAHAGPALYILLDTSVSDMADAPLINKIVVEFAKAIEAHDSFTKDIVVGVAEYPSSETNRNVKEVVPLGRLSANKELVLEALGNRKIVNNTNTDFGVAISQTIATIKARSPTDGGNILLLKTSGTKNESTFTLEQGLQLQLQDENIKLFAVEVTDTDLLRQNLAQVAIASQGSSLAIDQTTSSLEIALPAWLNEQVLKSYADPPIHQNLSKISYSSAVNAGQEYTFAVPAKAQQLTFVLTTLSKLNAANVVGGVVTSQIEIRAPFVESNEFGHGRFVYTGTLDVRSWNLNAVNFSFPGTASGQLVLLSEGSPTNGLPDITVTVVTSTDDFDFGNIQNPDAPFVVTAEVKADNNIPVTGARVVARILNDAIDPTQVELLEDHYSLNTEPGQYSGIVLLPGDGEYTVVVEVSKGTNTQTVVFSSSRLIPPSQNFPEERTVEFPVGLTASGRLSYNVAAKGEANFQPYVLKIRDLVVDVADDSGDATFTLTAPQVFEINQQSSPTEYRFYSSVNQDSLINLDVENLPDDVKEDFVKPGGGLPGNKISYEQFVFRDVQQYFGVVGFSGVISSPISNIVTISALEEPPTEPPTDEPTEGPTDEPTEGPTDEPTEGPTDEPTEGPTDEPTEGPTDKPTEGPTDEPTEGPTEPPGGSSSEQPEPSEPNKPWIKSTGGIVTVVVIVIVCFAAAAGGYWYMNKRRAASRGSTFANSP